MLKQIKRNTENGFLMVVGLKSLIAVVGEQIC